MAAGSVIVDLLMRTGSFETDTARAGKSLKRLQKEAEESSRMIKASFLGNLGAGFVDTFIRQIVRLPGALIDSLDRLNDLSDATGSSIENLSALENIARKNGQTFDDVSGILVKFNMALKEADGKNATSQALQQIGLDVRELRKLDPAEALRQTAVALSGFADDGEKARRVQELFGKSVRAAGPFLKDLAEAGKLNATVTTEQAKAAETFNKELFAMQTSASDAARSIIGDLVPALTETFRAFSKLKEQGGGSFLRGLFIQSTQANLQEDADRISADTNRITDSIQRMNTELERSGGDNPRLASSIKFAREKLQGLQRQAMATADALKGLANQKDPLAPDTTNFSNEGRRRALAPLPDKPEKIKKVRDEFGPLLRQVTEMNAAAQLLLDTEGELTAAQKLGAKVAADYAEGILKITPAELAQIDAALKVVDALEREGEARERLDRAMQDSRNENAVFLEQQMQLRDSFIEQALASEIESAAFGKTREEVDALATARLRDAAAAKLQRAESTPSTDLAEVYRAQAGAILATANARDQLAKRELRSQTDVLQGARDALRDFLADNAKAGDQTYKLVRDSFQGLEDLGVAALTGGDLKNAAKSLVNQVLQEFYRLYVIKPLLQSIFGGSGGGDWLSALGKIAGYLGGFSTGNTGNTGVISVPSGFEMAAGTNYVPRDNFPARLHKGEAVVPKAYNPAAGGRGVTFNIVNNGQPVTAREESRQESSQGTMINLVLDALVSDVQKGGKSHRALSSTYGLSRAGKKRA